MNPGGLMEKTIKNMVLQKYKNVLIRLTKTQNTKSFKQTIS